MNFSNLKVPLKNSMEFSCRQTAWNFT